MKKLICFTSGLLSFASYAIAQNSRASQLPDCRTRLGVILQSTDANQKATRVRAALDYEQNAPCFAEILLRNGTSVQAAAFSNFIRDFQEHRNDKQIGSLAGSGGSTTLVSKGLTAQAISLAAEYGALTQSVNKQVVTVRGSLGGFVAALTKQNLVEYCPSGAGRPGCVNRDTMDLLKRISYGVSFDTSQNSENLTATPAGQPAGTAQPVTFTASRHQISAWNGRVVLWKTRDAASDRFKTKLLESLTARTATGAAIEVKAAGDELFKSFQTFVGQLKPDGGNPTDRNNPYVAALIGEVAILQSATTQDQLDAAFDAWADRFVTFVQDNPTMRANAISLLETRSAYAMAEEALVAELADQPVLVFEYNNNRPVGQDPTSSFRLIFDKGFGNWSVAANAAATIYDKKPQVAGASRWRDAQVGVQAQRDLGKILATPAAVSFSYYFQYQNGPAVLNVTPGTPLPGIVFIGLPSNATQVFAQTGNLHIAQARLVLSPGQSNVRFPLSVSYSNRTELIPKPVWRAQIGISYDFDGLLAK